MTASNRFRPRENPPQKVDGKTMTQQQFKDTHDINNIISQYNRTGLAPQRQSPAVYGDVSHIDYHAALSLVSDIDNVFHRLPSKIRGRFHNDVRQMLRFVEDPANEKEARKLGLLLPLPETTVDGQQTDLVEQAAAASNSGQSASANSTGGGEAGKSGGDGKKT